MYLLDDDDDGDESHMLLRVDMDTLPFGSVEQVILYFFHLLLLLIF